MMTVGKLKNYIREMSQRKKIPHEILYQNYFFERFLVRLSESKFQKKFILKGGFLISSMIGIEERTTADIDMTVQNLELSEEVLTETIKEITQIDANDNTFFNLHSVKSIRKEDVYPGIRYVLQAKFHSLKIFIKLDFSTGDIVTPNAVDRPIHLSISNENIELLSYNIETVLSEKIETILSRSVANTRMKDFYDVYSIMTKDRDNLDITILRKAINATFKYRGTQHVIESADSILVSLGSDENIKSLWETYKKDNIYVGSITLYEVITQVKELLKIGLI